MKKFSRLRICSRQETSLRWWCACIRWEGRPKSTQSIPAHPLDQKCQRKMKETSPKNKLGKEEMLKMEITVQRTANCNLERKGSKGGGAEQSGRYGQHTPHVKYSNLPPI